VTLLAYCLQVTLKAEHRILLDQLRLGLPSQPPPKITIAQA